MIGVENDLIGYRGDLIGHEIVLNRLRYSDSAHRRNSPNFLDQHWHELFDGMALEYRMPRELSVAASSFTYLP